MRPQGQVIVVVAVVLTVSLFLLALAVDGGRLYLERATLSRSAQAAADAGAGWVSERMVTQAVPRQTQAANRPPCAPDGAYGDPLAACTATPSLDAVQWWLTDEDRATLTSPEVQATVDAVALEYAGRNNLRRDDPRVIDLQVAYPYEYDPMDETLRVWVGVRRRATVLLAGILDKAYVEVAAEAISEIPQR